MAKQILNDVRILDGIAIPKTAGFGLKVDTDNPTYGWRDITGRIRPDPAGTDAPAIANFIGSVRAYTYSTSPAAKKLDLEFHMPHDWVFGTDLYLHLHWGHNGTDISGSLVVDYNISYGSRDGAFVTPITPTQTISSLAIGNTPQYAQRVDEFQISQSGGGVNLFDTDNIEVDGLILATLSPTTLPTITGGNGLPFIFTLDIHYQSTNVGTKNNASPFYG